MNDLWETHERFYNDGADCAATPEQQAAERAFRDAFVAAAREAARWPEPDQRTLDDAWEERRRTRDRNEVLVPSSIYFDRPGLDSEQIAYRRGHVVDAARARGRVHAFEYVDQCWNEFEDAGVPTERIGPLVIVPWVEHAVRWAATPLKPDRMSDAPPRPDECLTTEQRRVLEDPDFFPDPLSVRQLMTIYPELRPPVVHGLLRAGETLNLISAPKVGKSWLVIDLALALATGRPWLGEFEAERGDVLVVDNELHGETSANRIPKVALARGIPLEEFADRLFVENLRGRLRDIDALGSFFDAIRPGRFEVIIIDAFYRVLPRDADENSNATMASIYNRLDAYANRLGCAFILIHHMSKGWQSSKAVTDVGAGAGSQARATDTHLVLRQHEEPDCFVLDAAVRSWPPIEPRVLRWEFPVFTSDASLDPAALKPERPRRKPKERDTTPKEPPWTAERFASEFVGDEPLVKPAIIDAAIESGLSERRAHGLLRRAEARGLIHPWPTRNRRTKAFANVPAPDEHDEPADGRPTPKREAVLRVLRAEPNLSNREIARRCGASYELVRKLRDEPSAGDNSGDNPAMRVVTG